MVYKNIFVENQDNFGRGICKINNKVTFVPYILPNELVDIEIIEEHKKYNLGKCTNIVNKSSSRVNPKCKYYYECGGCNLMHQLHKEQLEFKKSKVIGNLKHIGNIDIDNVDIIYLDEFYYRNHITLSVNNDNIGFYHEHTNDIVNIDECVIANESINKCIKELVKFIYKYKNNNIKRISIKGEDEILIDIISDNFSLFNEFKNMINFSSLYINGKHYCGKKNITMNLSNYKYDVSALSFFQKNTNIANLMYSYIKEIMPSNKNVLDLYCGTGSIGIYISDKCKNVIGIEIIEDAVKDAYLNAKLNNVNNISFIAGKVEDNIDKLNNIDVVIVDPPRVGLSKKAINDIISINPSSIIYVSCNQETLSRDLKVLNSNYNVLSVKLFDMFPNTYHVESLVVLERIVK